MAHHGARAAGARGNGEREDEGGCGGRGVKYYPFTFFAAVWSDPGVVPPTPTRAKDNGAILILSSNFREFLHVEV